jgi:hypothetical protein
VVIVALFGACAAVPLIVRLGVKGYVVGLGVLIAVGVAQQLWPRANVPEAVRNATRL